MEIAPYNCLTDASIDQTCKEVLSEQAVKALIGVLKQPWPQVRKAAVDALVELAKHGRLEK